MTILTNNKTRGLTDRARQGKTQKSKDSKSFKTSLSSLDVEIKIKSIKEQAYIFISLIPFCYPSITLIIVIFKLFYDHLHLGHYSTFATWETKKTSLCWSV